MSELFSGCDGHPGLAVFLNAGDPPLDVLADVVQMLDDRRVDCLELAVPFPESVSDGAVVKASALRALDRGVGLEETMAFVEAIRPTLDHLRIALLVDWRHTVRPLGVVPLLDRLAASPVDALLVHAIPPRLRPDYVAAAACARVPIVATCYASSTDAVLADAAATASAYVYLVSAFGKSGGRAALDTALVHEAVLRLRAAGAEVPIAVGFGIRSDTDIAAVHGAGADAAIVGSALVGRVEHALAEGLDVVDEVAAFIDQLRPLEPALAIASRAPSGANHNHTSQGD